MLIEAFLQDHKIDTDMVPRELNWYWVQVFKSLWKWPHFWDTAHDATYSEIFLYMSFQLYFWEIDRYVLSIPMWPLFHDITVKFPSVLIPFSPSPLIGSFYISKIKYYLSQHTAVLCSAIFYYLLCCMMEDNVHPLNNRTNDGVPFWNVFDYQKRKCMIYIKMPKKKMVTDFRKEL